MGSGLLYGGIGVLWLVVLGRNWLNRRTLVRAERSAPASSRQRIINPRDDRRARTRTVLSVPEPAGPSRSVDRSRAVHRRRRILLLLVVLAAAAGSLFVMGRVAWWVPAVAAAAAVGWFVTGASAARAGRRARRGHRRRARNRELAHVIPVAAKAPAAPVADEPSWNSVPLVDVVARWGRDESDTDGIDRRELAAAAPLIQMPRSPVDQSPAAVEPPLAGSWQPVPVPLPTYLTAPRVPRTVARIDLACAGSWTSVVASAETTGGRGPVQLGSPPRLIDPQPRPVVEVEVEVEVSAVRVATAAAEDDELTAEVPYELPRAVGD